MLSAIDPADDAFLVDKGRARELCGVAQLRRAPVLSKTRCPVFGAATTQPGVTEETQQTEIAQPYRLVGALLGIGDALCAASKSRAETRSFLGRPHYYEAYADAGPIERLIELAQLRERFSEKRSTNMPQPDDERRQREPQLRYGVGHARPGHPVFLHLA
jgi:hypothetical protein